MHCLSHLDIVSSNAFYVFLPVYIYLEFIYFALSRSNLFLSLLKFNLSTLGFTLFDARYRLR